MRVLLGPGNPAGVATALRDGLRALGERADVAMVLEHPFGYAYDRLHETRRARVLEGLTAPWRYDVIHYQFAYTYFHWLDAIWARLVRRPLLLAHYWGDDARTTANSRRIGSSRAPGQDERLVHRRLLVAARLCRAALASEPELTGRLEAYFDRVYIVATPLVPPAAVPPPSNSTPVVLHAPSNASGKGTKQIVATLERIAARRPLDVRLVRGVSHAEVLREIAAADVVVDQLTSETPGVLALESMAIGRPVLVELRREFVAPRRRAAVPVVDVTSATLEERLEALLDDAERRRELGVAGRRYVEEHHEAVQVARAIRHVYRHARTAPPGVYDVGPEGVMPVASSHG